MTYRPGTRVAAKGLEPRFVFGSKRPSSTASNTVCNKSCLAPSNLNPVEDYSPHPRMRPSKSCLHISGRPTVLGTKSFSCQAVPPTRSKPDGGPLRTPVEKCAIPPAVSKFKQETRTSHKLKSNGSLTQITCIPSWCVLSGRTSTAPTGMAKSR